MAKPKKLEDQLVALELLDADPRGSIPQYADFLKHGHSLIVTKIARTCRRKLLHDFTENMVAAFKRMLVNGASTDSGCKAKEELIATLTEFGYMDPDLFILGCRHIQMEKVFGNPVDTAPNLRANSLNGLLGTGCTDANLIAADLLADPAEAPRQAAAQALTQLGGEAGATILRFKARNGDESNAVMTDVLSGLMQMDAPRHLDFVAQFLDGTNAAAAGIALGECGDEQALETLLEAYRRKRRIDIQEQWLVAIGLNRSERAFDFLLDIAREGGRLAEPAVKALQLFPLNESRQQSVDSVLERL